MSPQDWIKTYTESLLDITVDGKLSGSKSSHHEQTSAETSKRALKTKLLCNLDQTAGGSLSWKTLGLVDFAQHGISRLRDGGGGETSDESGSQVDGGLESIGGGLLVDALVDQLGDLLVHDELGHRIRNPEHVRKQNDSGTLALVNF